MMRTITVAAIVVLLHACTALSVSRPESPPLSIETETLRTHMRVLTGARPARNHRQLESLNRTARWIKTRLTEMGYQPEFQVFPVHDTSYMNVTAGYGPQDAPRLVIGAHYDVYGDFEGADDNASGVVGMLALAALLQEHKPRLNHRVELVAYTLEEPPYFRTGYMGSHVHAASLKESGVKVMGMISLEMIGYFSSRPGSQSYPLAVMKWFYPDAGDFIAVVGNFSSASLVKHVHDNLALAGIRVQSLRAPAFITGVDFSDHLNYWKQGYRAVMVTDTSFYRNHRYHTAMDTMDTLDYGKMKQVIAGIYYAVINLNGSSP